MTAGPNCGGLPDLSTFKTGHHYFYEMLFIQYYGVQENDVSIILPRYNLHVSYWSKVDHQKGPSPNSEKPHRIRHIQKMYG